MIEDRLHPTHRTRTSDAASYDLICVNCGQHDITGDGWGKLAEPCPEFSEDVSGTAAFSDMSTSLMER